MGSYLVPALANVFMRFYESKWVNEYNPKICWWHSGCLWQGMKNEYLLNFLSNLNKKLPNIKFVIEKQVNDPIAFLDAFISGINNQNITLQT